MTTYPQAKHEAQQFANEHQEDAVVLCDSEDLENDCVDYAGYWGELKRVYLEPFYDPNCTVVETIHPETKKRATQ